MGNTGGMLKWLILSAVIVALIDPFLLYFIYTHLGGWTWAVFLGPILIGNLLTNRIRANAASGQSDPLSAMAETMLAPFARMLLWYPGPITSLLGLLLLFAPTRKLALKIAMRRVTAAFSGQNGMAGMGGMGGMPGMNGMSMGMWTVGGAGPAPFNMSGMNTGSGGGGFRSAPIPPGQLKRADARVVEDDKDPPERPLLPE